MSNPGTLESQNPPNQPNDEPTTWSAYGGLPSQPPASPPQPVPLSQPLSAPSAPPPSPPVQQIQLPPSRSPVLTVLVTLLLVIILVAASIGGTLLVSGRLTAHRPPAPTPTAVDIPALGTQIAANVQATATATALQAPPKDPLAGTQILSLVDCISTGTGCTQDTTPQFTSVGPFDILWVCEADQIALTPNESLQMALFNSSGKQVAALAETCDGVSAHQGLISENLPAGSYKLTTQATTGPSWFVTVLEGAPSAGA